MGVFCFFKASLVAIINDTSLLLLEAFLIVSSTPLSRYIATPENQQLFSLFQAAAAAGLLVFWFVTAATSTVSPYCKSC